MKRGMLIALAVLVLVLAATAGFAIARGGLAASRVPASVVPQVPYREATGHPFGGQRRALQGTVVSWGADRLVMESRNVTYTVLISPRTRVLRRTGETVGARALVLGRSRDSAVNAAVVVLMPPEPRHGP
jgi:hypothetical protein